MKFTNEWTQFNVPIWEKYLNHLKGKPNLRALEIGTYEGQSAIWFLKNILNHKSCKIDVVDPFFYPNPAGSLDKHDLIKGRFLENTKRYESKLTLWEEFSFQALVRLHWVGGNEFDLIYVDGEHYAKNVLEDAVLAFALLKPGGIMIFDDYAWDVKRSAYGKPKIAVDAFLAVYGDKIDLLHKSYQVIIRKRS